MGPHELAFWNSAFCSSEKIAWLLDKPELELGRRWALLEESWDASCPVLDNLLVFEFRSYLQPILLRQDKMSMGASIEARVPILDNDMVDLAFSIPGTEKIKNLKPKYLFKRAAMRDLPSRIVNKRKVGFGVPVGAWMREKGSLAPFLDLLNDERRNLPGIVPGRLEQLIREHRQGISDHQDILWPLLNYALWRNVFLGR
jgi:asparagine synthase (glutamine-hydrolysing)